MFGTTQQGIFQIDRGKAKDAIRDFQAILQKTGIQQEGIHPQLQGFTMLQLSRAQSFFRQSVHESVSANTLLLADQAAEMVGRNTIDDPYTRIIMTGKEVKACEMVCDVSNEMPFRKQIPLSN